MFHISMLWEKTDSWLKYKNGNKIYYKLSKIKSSLFYSGNNTVNYVIYKNI